MGSSVQCAVPTARGDICGDDLTLRCAAGNTPSPPVDVADDGLDDKGLTSGGSVEDGCELRSWLELESGRMEKASTPSLLERVGKITLSISFWTQLSGLGLGHADADFKGSPILCRATPRGRGVEAEPAGRGDFVVAALGRARGEISRWGALGDVRAPNSCADPPASTLKRCFWRYLEALSMAPTPCL